MFQQICYYTPYNITFELLQNRLFQDLILASAGIYFRAAGHLVNKRCLDEYVLIYCIEGKGWLEIEDKHYDIYPGDLFICPPNIIHSYGADKINPWTKYWLHFRGNKGLIFMECIGISTCCPVFKAGISQNIIERFEHIFEVLKMGYTSANLLVASSDTQLILSELNSIRANGPFSSEPGTTVEAVIEFMLKHVCDNKTLEDFAHYSQISKYYLIRVFKDKTGYTPYDYYMRLKIQKACELLHSKTKSILGISVSLGFTDQFHFSKVFKKITGYSPTNYRKLQP